MTETDELRRLLDKCGVEWEVGMGDPLVTHWTANGIRWFAVESDDRGLTTFMRTGTAPEQIVAVSLSSERPFDEFRYRNVCDLLEQALETMSKWGT